MPNLFPILRAVATRQNLKLVSRVLIKTGVYISDAIALLMFVQSLKGVKIR
jgi:hypothetical protein